MVENRDDQDVLRVGDKMRFSVELIREIAEMPGHHSEIVVVHRIERAPDGFVEVHLRKHLEEGATE